MTNSDAYPSRHWGGDKHTGVRVVIADTGSGIVAENRSKVFRQVFTTKGGKGTGLGLQVSAKIIQKQGGSVRFRTTTRPGRSGTAFSVLLPALVPSNAETAA